jgi:hypothetical protein
MEELFQDSIVPWLEKTFEEFEIWTLTEIYQGSGYLIKETQPSSPSPFHGSYLNSLTSDKHF